MKLFSFLCWDNSIKFGIAQTFWQPINVKQIKSFKMLWNKEEEGKKVEDKEETFRSGPTCQNERLNRDDTRKTKQRRKNQLTLITGLTCLQPNLYGNADIRCSTFSIRLNDKRLLKKAFEFVFFYFLHFFHSQDALSVLNTFSVICWTVFVCFCCYHTNSLNTVPYCTVIVP